MPPRRRSWPSESKPTSKSEPEEFAAFLSERTGVEIYIDQRAITAAEGAGESPITIQLKLVRADMLLELALQQVGGGEIDYVIRDGLVVIHHRPAWMTRVK